MISEKCNEIFCESIKDYHVEDDVDATIVNPYKNGSLEHLLYLKNWIDTVQWHLEDLIRNPNIEASEALKIKRRIDALNQKRTDVVENIDSWFFQIYKDVIPFSNASINTETPAWAIDRLSILALKIYHMKIEVSRESATNEHRNSSQQKLEVLISQQKDLSGAIDQLLDDISEGYKYMKVYKQMKMYNDENLNPVLYKQKNKMP